MLTLFAQQPISFEEAATSWLGMAIASLGLFATIIAAMGVALAWRNGKLAHEERMKTLELGFLPPTKGSRWPVALYCALVGLGVPIGTFLLTWLASQDGHAPIDVWVAPGVVSVAALIGSSVVAAIGFGRSDRSVQAGKATTPIGKPASDPDALDFSGRLRHS